MNIAWYGAEVRQMVEGELARRLQSAAEHLADEIREMISHAGRAEIHSRPGQPPLRQTGRLERSIEVEAPSPLIRRVGSIAGYALALERGTRRMRPRP